MIRRGSPVAVVGVGEGGHEMLYTLPPRKDKGREKRVWEAGWTQWVGINHLRHSQHWTSFAIHMASWHTKIIVASHLKILTLMEWVSHTEIPGNIFGPLQQHPRMQLGIVTHVHAPEIYRPSYCGAIPPFIENHYFCDTAIHYYNPAQCCSGRVLHPAYPLWDGQYCGRGSCCTFIFSSLVL